MFSKLVVIAAVAAVTAAAEPEIVATKDGIMFLVEEGKNVGYKLGNGTNVYFNEMPNQWQQYTNTMFSVMKSGFDMGVSSSGGGSSSSSGVGYDVHKPLGLPQFPELSWSEIEKRAAGGTVNFWMWNGAGANRWVKGWLAKRMEKKYGIKVNIGTGVESTDPGTYGAPQAVVKVNEEIAQNPTSGGSVDLIWINGDNFANLKPNAYGPWAWNLPSSANYDWNAKDILFDFGTRTEGLEMPYNTAQFVFFCNTDVVTTKPTSIPELVTWIKANPGRFTYANPTSDFLGAAVVRHFFYYYAGAFAGGSYADFLGEFDETLYLTRSKKVWAVLNDIESSLTDTNVAGAQTKYPVSHDTIRDLYAANTIYLDGAYDPNHASTQILNAVYPNSTSSFVLEDGSISNLNYVAIPNNADNKYAALVAANMIASVEGVFTRTQPERWGTLPAHDVNSDVMVNSGWDEAFDYIVTHHAVPKVEDLDRTRVPELHSSVQTRIHNDWKKCVLQKSTTSDCV